ncbi:MAG: hypothetical protein WC342_07030 [Methanoregula sp.]|jgi:hypothetical protein
MGTKKQAEKTKKTWSKVAVITLGVLFVVLMVVSSLGMSWISSVAGVKSGDVVVIDYTILDANGTPIVTTSQQVYQQVVSSGSSVFVSRQLQLIANESATKAIMPIPVYAAGTWNNSFALFANEYDAISQGVVGMKVNGQKTISLDGKPMEQFWTVDQLEANNMNITRAVVGEKLALGVSNNPTMSNSSTDYSIRIGEIINKTPEGVGIDFSYPSIKVTVVSRNGGTS